MGLEMVKTVDIWVRARSNDTIFLSYSTIFPFLKMDADLNDGDTVTFISTLHGG